MSDLADRAGESCGAVEGAGGVFAGRARTDTDPHGQTRTALRGCSCGGRPAYRAHPPMTKSGPWTETLACGGCGNAVGPFASRQQLAEAWRLGGWEAEERGEKQEVTGKR